MSGSVMEEKDSTMSGNLEGISIDKRPALRLNQLTVSLTEIVRSCRPPLKLAKRDSDWFS